MRRLLSWVLIICVILGGVYALIPYAARHVVEIWLTEQGFENPRFSLSYPAWNELRINEISLSQENADRRIGLNAGPILIRYNPTQLLLSQRLSEIQIPTAKLTLSYKPTISRQGQEEAAKLALLPLVPTRLIGLLPAERLLVGELSILLSTPERPDWHFRGALDLTDFELISRVHLRYGDEVLGWSDLRFDDSNRFNLQMLYQNTPFVTLDGILSHGEELKLQFRQKTHITRLREWLTHIEPSIAQRFKLDGTLNSQGTLKVPTILDLQDRNWLKQIQSQQQLKASLALANPVPELTQLVLKSSMELEVHEGVVKTTMMPGSQLKVFPRDQVDSPLPPLLLAFSEAFEISTPLQQPQQTHLSTLGLELKTKPLRLENRLIRSAPAQLTLSPFSLDQLSLNGKLTLPGIKVTEPDQVWPVLDFETRFNLVGGQLHHRFKLTARETPLKLQGSASWHGDKQRADFNWQMQPVGLKKIEHLIARYIPTLPAELQVSAGLLEHRGWGYWQQDKLNLTLRQNIRDLRFNWDQFGFQQSQWRSEMKLRPNGSWQDKGQFLIGLLDAGLPIENIHGYYRVDRNRKGQLSAQVNNSQCTLLGGEVRIEQLNYRPDDSFSTTLEVKRLQLEQLLALEQQPGLKGKGTLSGTLPLNYYQGQLTINDGELESLPPGGFIRYTPTPAVKATASANPGLKMALNALENFHYNQLKIGITYLPDGTALLDTRLKGKNPDWNNGHPVNLGVNVEENLPQLIKTLQITEQLTKSIKKRYR